MDMEVKKGLVETCKQLRFDLEEMDPEDKKYESLMKVYASTTKSLIDADAIGSNEKVELEKAKTNSLTKGKVLVEVGKAVIGLVGVVGSALICAASYERMQDKAYEFERDGVVKSPTTKGLHISGILPRPR